MKSLFQYIKESLAVNEGHSAGDIKLFWKWIEALGGEEFMQENYSHYQKTREEDFAYNKIADLGTTARQFKTFTDIFFEMAEKALDLMYEEDDAFGGDDSMQYGSWSCPFAGEKEFLKMMKDSSRVISFAANYQYQGEIAGYIFEPEDYEDYLKKNKLNPGGFR